MEDFGEFDVEVPGPVVRPALQRWQTGSRGTQGGLQKRRVRLCLPQSRPGPVLAAVLFPGTPMYWVSTHGMA